MVRFASCFCILLLHLEIANKLSAWYGVGDQGHGKFSRGVAGGYYDDPRLL